MLPTNPRGDYDPFPKACFRDLPVCLDLNILNRTDTRDCLRLTETKGNGYDDKKKVVDGRVGARPSGSRKRPGGGND